MRKASYQIRLESYRYLKQKVKTIQKTTDKESSNKYTELNIPERKTHMLVEQKPHYERSYAYAKIADDVEII